MRPMKVMVTCIGTPCIELSQRLAQHCSQVLFSPQSVLECHLIHSGSFVLTGKDFQALAGDCLLQAQNIDYSRIGKECYSALISKWQPLTGAISAQVNK